MNDRPASERDAYVSRLCEEYDMGHTAAVNAVIAQQEAYPSTKEEP